MGQVTNRNNLTSRGTIPLGAWINPNSTYMLLQLILGSNPSSKLEVVSALNSFNISDRMLQYYHASFYEKYNPKIYLGAVQSVAEKWNQDLQTGQTNGLPNLDPGQEKSGSWPRKF